MRIEYEVERGAIGHGLAGYDQRVIHRGDEICGIAKARWLQLVGEFEVADQR